MTPRRVGASRQGRSQEHAESIYAAAWHEESSPAGPALRTYNVPVPTASPGDHQSPGYASIGSHTRQHIDSSQVANCLFQPPPPPAPEPIPLAARPPNHKRGNIAVVKEISTLNQLRRQAEAQERMEAQQAGAPKPAPRRSVPAAVAHNRRDFVRENCVVAPVRQQRQRQPVDDDYGRMATDDGLKYRNKPDFGRVPTYLLERKLEMFDKQESELRAKEMSHVPPGMRQLSEEERLSTLSVLQKNRMDLEAAVNSLPLRIETPSQIRRRNNFEDRIHEVEEGIKAFSRQRVLVKL